MTSSRATSFIGFSLRRTPPSPEPHAIGPPFALQPPFRVFLPPTPVHRDAANTFDYATFTPLFHFIDYRASYAEPPRSFRRAI